MTRKRALLLLPLVVVSLLITGTPPANATTAGEINFVASMQMGNGIASSCLTGKSTPPSLDATKCGGFLTSTNTASISVTTTIANGSIEHGPTKGSKALRTESGTFVITASGWATGSCELMTGTISGTISPAISLGTKAKARTFVATFTAVDGKAVVQGSTSKGESIFGEWDMFVSTGTCVNKAPKSWTLIGVFNIVRS